MREIKICKKCCKFQYLVTPRMYSCRCFLAVEDFDNGWTRSTNEKDSIEEFCQSGIPKDCPYVLEQTLSAQ